MGARRMRMWRMITTEIVSVSIARCGQHTIAQALEEEETEISESVCHTNGCEPNLSPDFNFV